MGFVIRQTLIELLPVGEYPAIISAVEPAEGQYGPQLKFTFSLTGRHQGKKLTGYCSQSFNIKSNLFKWTRAALGGRDIPPDWDLDIDQLLDKPVILVAIKKTGSDGTEFNKIDSLLPARPTSPAAQTRGAGPSSPATPVSGPPDEDDLPF